MEAASVHGRLQRLLYLHTRTPSVFSDVLGHAAVDPVPGPPPEIRAVAEEPPYASVHAAMVDGWHVIDFPSFAASAGDEEMTLVGYQFILQKLT